VESGKWKVESEERLDKNVGIKKNVSPPSHAMEGWLERLSEQTGWLFLPKKI
jgi:hypothetical protein